MSNLKLCQGPLCHTYSTQDRLKGTKGNKTYQTRRRSSFYYLSNNACSMQCERDWFEKFGEQALNHFGRITEAKHLREENAWQKKYRWNWQRENGEAEYYYLNTITKEQRSLTEAQYNDRTFTINTGE